MSNSLGPYKKKKINTVLEYGAERGTHFTSNASARIPAAMGAALDVPGKYVTQPSSMLVTVTCGDNRLNVSQAAAVGVVPARRVKTRELFCPTTRPPPPPLLPKMDFFGATLHEAIPTGLQKTTIKEKKEKTCFRSEHRLMRGGKEPAQRSPP